jgi:hypothetical protein
MIDITYDFRTDARGKDPDQTSPTLRRYHKLLWSKPLPNGEMFNLDESLPGIYLHHKSETGEFNLASDSVISTFSRWKRLAHVIEQVPQKDTEEFVRLSYTIGGMMIFPSNRVGGKPTINGERGFNRKIADRFDLTLECIRRHYLGDDSPLSEALNRYASFFSLFDNFQGYVDYFLLQDLVTEGYSKVTIFEPFDDFISTPVPKNLEEYLTYRKTTIDFVNARNRRIADLHI